MTIHIVSLATAAVLFILSILHFVWGLRIWWPVKDETELAKTIAGFRNISSMPPPSSCMLVTLALVVGAGTALRLGGGPSEHWNLLILAAGAASSAVLLCRGLAGYTAFWAKLTPEQPFRSLDRRVYSPLCVTLGLSLSLLVLRFAKEVDWFV